MRADVKHLTITQHGDTQVKKSVIVFLVLAGLSCPAARAADYTNSIGMQFNDIPAGS